MKPNKNVENKIIQEHKILHIPLITTQTEWDLHTQEFGLDTEPGP